MFLSGKQLVVAVGVVGISGLLAGAAQADFDLQITEIWPGNEPGENQTEDWIEITNFGDMAWTDGTDGTLWYDDDSQDEIAADQVFGIPSIAAGESVIVVIEAADAVTDWLTVWGPDLTSTPQVGYADGSGLSGGGDGATLFLTTSLFPSAGDLIDFEAYPDAEATAASLTTLF